MMRSVVAAFAVPLILAACAPASASDPRSEPLPASTRTPVPTATFAPDSTPGSGILVRTDSQGAVEFVVEPLNLNDAGDTLDFLVAMDTHSVDLGWDLAARSTLETDTGLRVEAVEWPVGGGHHYGGTLVFPRFTSDGQDLLGAARELRLIVRDTDVPERVFTWAVGP